MYKGFQKKCKIIWHCARANEILIRLLFIQKSSRGVVGGFHWWKLLYVHKFYGIVRRCMLYKINHAKVYRNAYKYWYVLRPKSKYYVALIVLNQQQSNIMTICRCKQDFFYLQICDTSILFLWTLTFVQFPWTIWVVWTSFFGFTWHRIQIMCLAIQNSTGS